MEGGWRGVTVTSLFAQRPAKELGGRRSVSFASRLHLHHVFTERKQQPEGFFKAYSAGDAVSSVLAAAAGCAASASPEDGAAASVVQAAPSAAASIPSAAGVVDSSAALVGSGTENNSMCCAR